MKKEKTYTHIVHPIQPLFDSESEILILGSLPSVKSREQCFFYGHPQNRFWKVLAELYHEPLLLTIEEKADFAHRHHIALWDTIYSCDIIGSSDSSIKNVVPTDLNAIIQQSKVQRIFCNGKTSGFYFRKYQEKELGIKAVVLPSTSPANAMWNMERLKKEWNQILMK